MVIYSDKNHNHKFTTRISLSLNSSFIMDTSDAYKSIPVRVFYGHTFLFHMGKNLVKLLSEGQVSS